MIRPSLWIAGLLLGTATITSFGLAASRSRALDREREQRTSLERQIASLRDNVRSLGGKPAPAPAAPSPPPDGAPAADLEPLRREIEDLKGTVARLEAENRALRQARGAEPPAARDQGFSGTVQSRALDPKAPAADRVEALMMLRGLPAGRTPAVVDSMLDLLESGIEPGQRRDILANLKGAVDAAKAARVVAFLQTDPDRVVRAEAAETLGPLRNDAQVRAALEKAARGDPSGKVRREAQAALDGGP